jgi:hypothetical protein
VRGLRSALLWALDVRKWESEGGEGTEVCRCGGGARKVFRWGKEPWSVEHFKHAELGPRAMGQKKRSGPRELLWFFSGPKGRFRCEPFLSASPTSYVLPS